MSSQYATVQEWIDFEQPAPAFAGVPDPVKNLALKWASSVANGYIKKRKVLPLLSWGDDLKAAVCELAGWYLISRRGFKPGSGSNETFRQRYDDALAWLVQVSKGDTELDECIDSTTTPDADEAGPLSASDAVVSWNYQTRGRECQ